MWLSARVQFVRPLLSVCWCGQFFMVLAYHAWCWVCCWSSCRVRVSSSAISVRMQFWKRVSVGLQWMSQFWQKTC